MIIILRQLNDSQWISMNVLKKGYTLLGTNEYQSFKAAAETSIIFKT